MSGMGKYEKWEVKSAYYQRAQNIRILYENDNVKPAIKDPKIQKYPIVANANKSIINYEGEGLTHHTFEAIGKSVLFPLNHWRRMFPSGAS